MGLEEEKLYQDQVQNETDTGIADDAVDESDALDDLSTAVTSQRWAGTPSESFTCLM